MEENDDQQQQYNNNSTESFTLQMLVEDETAIRPLQVVPSLKYTSTTTSTSTFTSTGKDGLSNIGSSTSTSTRIAATTTTVSSVSATETTDTSIANSTDISHEQQQQQQQDAISIVSMEQSVSLLDYSSRSLFPVVETDVFSSYTDSNNNNNNHNSNSNNNSNNNNNNNNNSINSATTGITSSYKSNLLVYTAGDHFQTFLENNTSFRQQEQEIIHRWFNEVSYCPSVPLTDNNTNKEYDNDNDNDNETAANNNSNDNDNNLQVQTFPSSILIVNGPADCGKTELIVRTIRELVTPKTTECIVNTENDSVPLHVENRKMNGGYFITAKFDFLQHPEPYNVLLTAITEFVNQVIYRGNDEIRRVQKLLHISSSIINDDMTVLSNMIPSIQLLLQTTDNDHPLTTSINSTTSSTCTKRQESFEKTMHRQRFTSLFVNFIKSICCVEHPIVLFLDDVQWADECSIDLLLSILCEVGSTSTSTVRNHGLYVCCTSSTTSTGSSIDTTTTGSNSFCSRYNAMVVDYSIQHSCIVSIDCLTHDETTHLLTMAFFPEQQQQQQQQDYDDTESVRLLSKVVNDQCNGQISAIVFFLNVLQQSESILYNTELKKWSINTDTITTEWMKSTTITTTTYPMYDLQLSHIMTCLSVQAQDVLKVASCLGYKFDADIIPYILPNVPVEHCLVEAMERYFITYNKYTKRYYFINNTIHIHFYSQIPIDQKELFHLEIGRRLWENIQQQQQSNTNIDVVDTYVFIILGQIRRGKRLINDEQDRHSLAELCFHGGTKAVTIASSFRIGAIYLSLGISFLNKRSWRSHYDLCLSMYNGAAEMEMLCQNYNSMDSIIDIILVSTRCTEDKVQAYSTRIYACSTLGKSTESIDIGLTVLKSLGEPLPQHKIFSTGKLILEILKLNHKLKTTSNDDILTLPTMTNTRKLACMTILQALFLNTLRHGPKLFPFVVLQMLHNTLLYGVTVNSSVAFVGYGIVLVGINKYDEAFRLGLLGLQFLHRYNAQEYLPRVYATFYAGIYPWKKPMQDTAKPIMEAYKVAIQTGDMEYAAICSILYIFQAHHNGFYIPQILQSVTYFKQSLGTNQQGMEVSITMSVMFRVFAGSASPDAMSDEALFSCGVRKDLFLTVCDPSIGIRVLQMIVKYHLGDYDDAATICNYIVKHLWIMPPIPYTKSNAKFYIGMVAIEMVLKRIQHRKYLKLARKCIKELKSYSKMCPDNFLHYQTILEAQLLIAMTATTTKKITIIDEKKICEKFTNAIQLCKCGGYIQAEALANACIAKFFISIKQQDKAEPYQQQACTLFHKYGAHALADRIIDSKK